MRAALLASILALCGTLSACGSPERDPSGAEDQAGMLGGRIRVALKLVELGDYVGAEAESLVEALSKTWGVCGVGFEIAAHEVGIDAGRMGLADRPQDRDDLHAILDRLGSRTEVLVAFTGRFEIDGATVAMYLYDGPREGIVMDGTEYHLGLIAHELGHLMGLDHVEGEGTERNLMVRAPSAVPGEITPEQCRKVRATLSGPGRRYTR